MEVYKQPLYYEIAFGFVDPKEQVDNFEKIFRDFSKIRVNSFLDIAWTELAVKRNSKKRL